MESSIQRYSTTAASSIKNILRHIKNTIFNNLMHDAKVGDNLFLPRIIQFSEYQLQKALNKPNPRYRSNQALKKISENFSGDIINVSGWLDLDKQGNTYKSYFPKVNNYMLSNYSGDKGRNDGQNEIFLNLEETIPSDLKNKFDVVFNHTTLEHVQNINQSLQSLFDLTKDVVIIVVPFAQDYHVSNTFDDYHRFSPTGLKHLLENIGLKIISCDTNKNDGCDTIYTLITATKNPDKRDWIGPTYDFDRDGDNAIFSKAAITLKNQNVLTYY